MCIKLVGHKTKAGLPRPWQGKPCFVCYIDICIIEGRKEGANIPTPPNIEATLTFLFSSVTNRPSASKLAWLSLLRRLFAPLTYFTICLSRWCIYQFIGSRSY